MQNVLIVYCVDDKYFHLLEHNILSIQNELVQFPIGIIDIGLSQQNKDRISELSSNVHFVNPGWKLSFPGMENSPIHKKGMIARAFLPDLFPGYDGYFYSDADVWFPDSSAVTDYITAARSTGAAIGVEAHPVYELHHTLRHITYGRWSMTYGYKSHLFSNCLKMFGPDIAFKMANYSLINSGILYLDSKSPIWDAWVRYYQLARLAPQNLSNQTCLHVAIVQEGLEFAAMPATHNWLPAKGVPAIDPATRNLVDPSFPYSPIKAIHLTDKSESRVFSLTTTDRRETIETHLTRPAFLQWQAESLNQGTHT